MCVPGSPVAISNHTYELARLVYTRLSSWQHSNGQCLAELYHGSGDGFTSSKTQGPIVNFNVLRADGSYVGFTQVINVDVQKLVTFLDFCSATSLVSVADVCLSLCNDLV